MHAALVLHLHLQSFQTDIPRLGLSLFCFWRSFTKRDLFFFLFFPIKFLCHGDKSSQHYTWPLYRIQLLHGESVAEPKRDLCIRSLGENEVYVVCWISESPNHFCILLIGWLIDLRPNAFSSLLFSFGAHLSTFNQPCCKQNCIFRHIP